MPLTEAEMIAQAIKLAEAGEQTVSLVDAAASLYPTLGKISTAVLIRRLKRLLVIVDIKNKDAKFIPFLKRGLPDEVLDKIPFLVAGVAVGSD